MILLINICKERLHYFEFVRPFEETLRNNGIKFFTRYYKEVNESDLKKSEKVIICGTSLKDNDFSRFENLRFFNWIRDFNKPVLGICGGMQVIGAVHGAKLGKKTEIGFFREKFNKEFLGISKGREEKVYHLHNNIVYFYLLEEFESFCDSEVSQAIKHKEKELYGVLFHPEVRNKGLIVNFCKK